MFSDPRKHVSCFCKHKPTNPRVSLESGSHIYRDDWHLETFSATLWKHNLSVCTLLVVLCLAHWAFCIERMYFYAMTFFKICSSISLAVGITGFGIIWDPELEECTVDFGRAHRELMAFYLYSTPYHYTDHVFYAPDPLFMIAVVWDTVILVLTVLALYKQHGARHSPLWSALLTQGTGYLIITCLTNIPMTVSFDAPYLYDI